MKARAAIYSRVSTSSQVQSQTIEQQLERLTRYVAQQGWELQNQHIFRGDGHSGASLGRPGLDRLRDSLCQGEVDYVVVTAPDRLARNYVHQMILLDEAEDYGCRIEFLDRPMSQDPHDRLLVQIRSAVAEYGRTLITDRMGRGQLARHRAGTLLPWTRPPYGYRLGIEHPRDPAGLRIEEGEAAIVKEIYRLYVHGSLSLCKLAQHLQALGIPTPSGRRLWRLATLRGIVRQPAYTGKVYAGRCHYRRPRVRRSATHAIGTAHDAAVEAPADEWVLVGHIPALVSQDEYDLLKPG